MAGARGVAWPILLALGARDSGSNPGGPIRFFSVNFLTGGYKKPSVDFIRICPIAFKCFTAGFYFPHHSLIN